MIQVTGIPAFEDNYIWIARDDRHAVVVDPGDADPVLEYLAREKLDIEAILVTHHHGDHTGGIDDLIRNRAAPVFGPRGESIHTVTRLVSEPDEVVLPRLGLKFKVLDVPGHTRGHIAYQGHGWVFCGDTLFGCGCGRLFEGSAEQMAHSLGKLAALPADTAVFCAHEYTESNIRFASVVEPENLELKERARQVRALRQEGLPTLPSRIGLELATNPFLRCAEPAVRKAAETVAGRTLADEVAVFACLRQWKNTF